MPQNQSVPLLALFALLAPADRLRDLELLSETKQYFELRDRLASDTGDELEVLYFKAEVEEKFNRLQASNRLFADYLKRDGKKKHEAHRNMAANYSKLGEYGKAANSYTSANKEKHDEDIENVEGMFGALKDVPPQTVTFKEDTDIPITKSFNVNVEGNGETLPFIFDTGANFTTVTETYAKKLGLKIIDAKVMVGGITGAMTPARLGVADEIKIGNAVVKNAVFLVFADKDLYVTAAHFQLNGILGFPVISAMREITLTKDGRLRIPREPKAKGLNNLALDGFTPLVQGTYKDAKLTFAFDTGANTTMFYSPFYNRFEEEVKQFEKGTHQFAGVGSAKSVPAHFGKDLKLQVGGQEVVFKRVPVVSQLLGERSAVLFGNLGQDMVRQFESMTINFEQMSLEFGGRVGQGAVGSK